MTFNVVLSLIVWFCTSGVVYSINAAGCEVGGWDKLMRTVFIWAGTALIGFLSIIHAFISELSFVSLLARLTGFVWGYNIADLFWSRTDKYNWGIRKDWDE